MFKLEIASTLSELKKKKWENTYLIPLKVMSENELGINLKI